MARIKTLVDQWAQLSPITWAEQPYGWILEGSEPITLEPWQRAVLAAYWQHRALVSTLFISTVKKAGKTLLDSLLTCYRWLTIPHTHFVVGNDKDQSSELQFSMIRQMCERHPVLSHYVRATRDTLTFEPTGSRIVSLPMDYKGGAGANFATVSITELWGFEYEHAQRLYEELTPIPGDCLRVVDSYAGFEGESLVLKRAWERGEGGDPVTVDGHGEWPITLTGQQLSYIHQGERAQRRCWRGTDAEREAYYAEQRETLRAATYDRLHLNLWGESEAAFIPLEWWKAGLDPALRPLPPNKGVPIHVGVDAACKPSGDDVGVIGCYQDNDRVCIAWHKVWRGGKRRKAELRLDTSVMPYLERQHELYRLESVNFDPRFFTTVAHQLRDKGLPMHEVTQSLPVLGRLGQGLYNLLQGGQLAYYRHGDLENLTAGAVAKEVSSGLHIKKGKGKVDLLVALSFAAGDLSDGSGVTVGFVYFDDDGSLFVPRENYTPPERANRMLRYNGRPTIVNVHGQRVGLKAGGEYPMTANEANRVTSYLLPGEFEVSII